jgi:hypothetical protein
MTPIDVHNWVYRVQFAYTFFDGFELYSEEVDATGHRRKAYIFTYGLMRMKWKRTWGVSDSDWGVIDSFETLNRLLAWVKNEIPGVDLLAKFPDSKC